MSLRVLMRMCRSPSPGLSLVHCVCGVFSPGCNDSPHVQGHRHTLPTAQDKSAVSRVTSSLGDMSSLNISLSIILLKEVYTIFSSLDFREKTYFAVYRTNAVRVLTSSQLFTRQADRAFLFAYANLLFLPHLRHSHVLS